MKPSDTTRKIADAAVGAAVGAAIAGPAGAVAGGLIGSQVAAHSGHASEAGQSTAASPQTAGDPMACTQVQRILVPVDFSPHSLNALRVARQWAGRFGSEILLLHVLEPILTYASFAVEPVAPVAPLLPSEGIREQTRVELEKLAKQEDAGAPRVSVHLREGAAFDQIVSAARELNADLIVIATHGRTGLAHVLLGSTAERVVRYAQCPVLTLRCTQ